MDDLHPAASGPRPTLIVKLKVNLPGEKTQTSGQTPLQTERPEIRGPLQQDASDIITLKASPTQLEHVTVDSPQSLFVTFPLSHVRQEPIASTVGGDVLQSQGSQQGLPSSEISSSKKIASLPDVPRDDATTTGGAPFQEFAPETDPTIDGEATRDHDSTRDPESECIRVTKPRPAGEDAPQPGLEAEAEPPAPRHRASISISDLLRPVSEEPVAQDEASPPVVMTADVSPAVAATDTASAPQPLKASDETKAPRVLSEPIADVPPPHPDVNMQEPDSKADVPEATPMPQTPQTAKVTIKLSPAGMAKYEASRNSIQPFSYYGRDRNPRRNATKAFAVVKTPEAVVRTTKPRKETAKLKETATAPRSKKRGAQENGEPAATKRHKPNGSSPNTRSSQGTSEASTTTPEFEVGPAFELDLATGEPRPIRDVKGDGMYVQLMLKVLGLQSTAKTNDTAKEQSVTMKALLERATHAQEQDALFLTSSEAMEQLAPGKFWNNVIITAEQQPLPLQTIDQFLREFYEEEVLVWIQDCSAKSSKQAPSIRQVPIKAVRERFASDQPVHPKPWNLLELATHHEDGLRPRFLNNEDCRLLTKLKIPTAADHTRRKTYPVGFKEVEKWALLAQAGALTLPHQDSHGYSTYITVNVGLVGFGWLSSPTTEKRAEWNKRTQKFIDGPWKYVVLKPGQTVYFPAGTVHFVFRLPSAGNTLAFGGHVLRCSNIVHWVRCLLEEVKSASVTNEDLTDSATGYLERVERFVVEAKKSGGVERWGGAESIDEFLMLKAKFTALKRQSTK